MIQALPRQWDLCGRGVLAVLVLLAYVLALPAGALADVFTVEGVEVDATAASATAARERAILAGQQKALEQLFDRVTPRDQRAALPRSSATEIGDLVRDFAVEAEKTSAVRYLASLTVRFRPDAIRAMLRAANVSFAETMSKPIVIVPVVQSSAGMTLWDETNPWLIAWQRNQRSGLVPFVVPAGDLEDGVALDAARAKAGDPEGLAALAWRYKAGNVIVATAETRQQDERVLSIQLTSSRFDAEGRREGTQVRTIVAEGASREAQWQRAAALMAEDIEDAWKRTNLIRFDSERSLIATAPLAGLSDLVELRKRLAAVSFLRSYELLAVARDSAQLRLHFFGDERQLAIALAQSDLVLLAHDSTSWTLQRSAVSPRGTVSDRLQQPPR